MAAYYNEIDHFAAQWLRELIRGGHIAPGDVDERSIEDVHPNDLRRYTQCHFFAGIGVWSLALRRAGWADDRAVWTGSCPCQPFSAAGAGNGFDDERHLWPHWHYLIEAVRPGLVLGEQVAGKIADPWVDLVQTDMEGLAYAFGAVAFPSASVGAPHIRDRTYWVADASSAGLPTCERDDVCGTGRRQERRTVEQCGGASERLEHAQGDGRKQRRTKSSERSIERRREPNELVIVDANTGLATGPTNGVWAAADWLLCRDGRWRPVEPGSFPLAHGSAGRVGRLRGYGNAINAYQAQILIETVMGWLR